MVLLLLLLSGAAPALDVILGDLLVLLQVK